MITKKHYLLIFLLSTFFIGNLAGQELENRNWLFEFGLVKSYMSSTLDIADTEAIYKAKLNYNWLLPSLRLSRKIDFKKQSFSIKPFIGFAILGGNRGSFNKATFQLDSTTYFLSIFGARYQIYHAEFGNFFNYTIKNFDIQFGLKGQYLLGKSIIATLDYSPQRVRLIPTPSPDNNELRYSGKRLADFSANAGLRIQYNWKRFSFATEYWQGLTDLSVAESDWFKNDIYEHNFRLMLGYRL